MSLDTKHTSKSVTRNAVKISLFDPPTNQHKEEHTRFTQLDWGQQ